MMSPSASMTVTANTVDGVIVCTVMLSKTLIWLETCCLPAGVKNFSRKSINLSNSPKSLGATIEESLDSNSWTIFSTSCSLNASSDGSTIVMFPMSSRWTDSLPSLTLNASINVNEDSSKKQGVKGSSWLRQWIIGP